MKDEEAVDSYSIWPILSKREIHARKDLWPINDMWNLHYFGQMAFNAGPERHTAVIENSYGGAKDAKEFCMKSQWVSYESNKALYEGWLDHMWNDATGVMLWMSGASYPSMVWQTYDYYYDLTGAYFGCNKLVSRCISIGIP